MPARPVTGQPTMTMTQEDVAGRLRIAINRLQRRLRQESLGGLSPAQASALGSVSRHGNPTLGELAGLEQVQPPTMTRIVAGLAEAGMVTRVADVKDRRSARVRTTPAGSARSSRSAPARTRSCCAGWTSWARTSNTTRPSWSRCSSTCWSSREAQVPRGGPPHVPCHLGAQLPAVLHRAGDLGLGHLDADGGAGLSHPLHPARHRHRRGHRDQPAVPAPAPASARSGACWRTGSTSARSSTPPRARRGCSR